MKVSVYNDGENTIRAIPDRNAGNATEIESGEETIVEAEGVIELQEVEGNGDTPEPEHN
ncbi:hypothetical protein [Paraburkholderia bannensis]|uniref:hypothetical protein n=1 Tax=Paraburkholderia bannensis TaxID=765414 RepID=UPI002AC3415B|nr:hypothetical protein [Paraburkholderia bannensis]